MASSDENTKKLEQQLIRLEAKVDDSNEHLSSIDVTLALQHESLRLHMKRSDQLEDIVKGLKTKSDMTSGAIKMLGLIATILTVLEAIRALK
jgi:predicted nuclease with TOPRIM domain